jgi:hypothetical protein
MPEVTKEEFETMQRAPKGRVPRGRKPKLSIKEIRQEIDGGIRFFNSLIASVPRYGSWALTDGETDLVIEALIAEANTHPTMVRWLERAAGVSPHLLLLQAALVIGARRYAIYQAEKNGVPFAESNDLDPAAIFRKYATPDAPVSMEAGGAPYDHWGHGDGQNVSRKTSRNGSPLQRVPQVES